MSLFRELHRRRVTQVAAAYALTAWLLVQVVVAVEEPLSLPDFFDTLVILLLAIGFPIALILAWAFQVTSDGVRIDSAPAGSFHGVASRWLSPVLQALVLLAVSFLVVDQYFLDDDGLRAAERGPSAAVNGTAESDVERWSIVLPPERPISFQAFPALSLALSPDARTVAYVSMDRLSGDTSSRLVARRSDSLSVIDLPGTENAVQPFFSPDGQWIAFFAKDSLKKVSLRGGGALTLATGNEIDAWTTGIWLDDDRIVFTSVTNTSLYTVPTDGGAISVLLGQDSVSPEDFRMVSDYVHGTDIVLFHRVWVTGRVRSTIEALRISTGERSVVVENGGFARYLPSGYLLFQRDGQNVVAPFDAQRLILTGPAVPLVDNIRFDSTTGPGVTPQLAVSRTGTLAYARPPETRGAVVLVDRNGNADPIGLPLGYYSHVSVSSDGRMAALQVGGAADSEVLVLDIERRTTEWLGQRTRDMSPEWHPISRSLTVSSYRSEQGGLFEIGPGNAERLLVAANGDMVHGAAWHPHGNVLAFTRQRGVAHDIWMRTDDDDAPMQPLVATPAAEYGADFSMDGQWLAYSSVEGPGDFRVYVRAFPEGSPIVAYPGLALEPHWSKSRADELFFVGLHDREAVMYAVTVSGTPDEPVISAPQPLFSMLTASPGGENLIYDMGSNQGARLDVLPDGRFLMVQRSTSAFSQHEIVVVRNWAAEVQRTAPNAP